ncbi:hypothetical protein CRYUN_Cryun18bG0102700 [Craigia yunnanensis]
MNVTDVVMRSIGAINFLNIFREANDHRYADLQVKNTSGGLWTFRLICRDGIYAKPVFSKGWLEFVYAKNLKIYDKVVMYEEKDVRAAVPYIIEVRRKIMSLMGQDIWVEVKQLHLYGVA